MVVDQNISQSGSTMVRINWKDGQLLLPEHFMLSENAQLLADSKRFQMLGLAYYGFADLRFERPLLDAGILQFSTLKVLNIYGQIFEQGENLTVLPCDLSEVVKNSGVLHLHIFASEPKDIKENGQMIEVKQYKGILSVEESLEGAISTFSFLKVFVNPSNIWEVEPYHSMPIFSFKNSFIWEYYKAQILEIMLCVEQHLKDDQIKTNISPVKFIMAKMVTISHCELKHKLTSVDMNGPAMPNDMFEALYHFYIHYALYTKDEAPDEISYDVRKICESFNKLIHQLNILSKHEVTEASLLPFIKGKRYFQLSYIPSQILSSTRVYLLIKKVDEAIFDITNVKLASTERLPLIRQKALPGISLLEDKGNQFSHLFDSSIVIYRIEPGTEWDHAISTASLGVSIPGEMDSFRVYLYSPEYHIKNSGVN